VYLKDDFKTEGKMDLADKFTQMGTPILVNGLKTEKMVWDECFTQMEIFMKENLWLIQEAETGFFFIKKKTVFLKEFLEETQNQEKERSFPSQP